MRDILFRGKRVDNGKWIYGYYIKATHHWHNHGIHEDWIATDTVQNGGWCNVRGKYAVVPDTIGQFTGLLDKNSNKIFEGDIINGYNSNGEKYIENSAVEWSDLFVAWNVNGYISLYGCNLYFYEVIGNIHDNPELLRTPQNDEVRE